MVGRLSFTFIAQEGGHLSFARTVQESGHLPFTLIVQDGGSPIMLHLLCREVYHLHLLYRMVGRLSFTL